MSSFFSNETDPHPVPINVSPCSSEGAETRYGPTEDDKSLLARIRVYLIRGMLRIIDRVRQVRQASEGREIRCSP